MTTETQSTEQTTEATATTDIGDLPFADYVHARRTGEMPTSPAKSAPEAKATEQNDEESDTSEKEAKEKDESLDEDSEEETEAKDDKPKKKGGWQRRIEKLVSQRESERRRAEALEMRLAALEAAGGTKAKAEATPAKDGEPNPDQFETHAEYVKAVARWEAKQEILQELKERDAKAEQAKLHAEQEKVAKAHEERVKAFREKTTDWDEVISDAADIQLSPAAVQVVIESEVGPALLYELAKNTAEAERISQLGPIAAARELGKLEAKIQARASEEKKPEPKTQTKAPKPINPVGGNKGTVPKSLDDPDLSFAEYVRMRREQEKRRA